MKRIINIIVTFFVFVILKGCIIAPLYLCYQLIVTIYRYWRGHLWCAIRFEILCVWHTLRNDWHDGCKAIVFEVKS